jgi:hypothetical protein
MGFPKTGLFDGFTRSHSDGRRWRYYATKGVWKIKQEINENDSKYTGLTGDTGDTGATGDVGATGNVGAQGEAGADGYPFAQEALSSSPTTTLTLDTDSTNFKVNLTGNTALEFASLTDKEGTSGTIALMQDATGGRTFTMPSTFKTPVGGASITQVTTPNSVSLLSFYVLDSSNVLVNYIGDFS